MTDETIVIGCYNRCLVCLRVTPHEVCHEHSEAMGGCWPEMVPDPDDPENSADFPQWVRDNGFPMEPEVCDDPQCPQAQVDWT